MILRIEARRDLFQAEGGWLDGVMGVQTSARALSTSFVMSENQKRVLVVDDQAAVRDLVETLLRHSGHEVETAGSGSEALLKLEGCDFDLVVTDFLMPGMNGDELAREIKKRSPQLPIVLITGQQLDEVSPDISLVLGKPFSRDELQQAIGALT